MWPRASPDIWWGAGARPGWQPQSCPAAALRASSGETASFREKKEALKRCLAREYRSFFRPFEAEFYTEGVTFRDPLNNLVGKEKYRGNVEMLSGNSLVGNILFSDGYIDLHAVEEVPGDERRLRTRWTLGFTFKLLPWQPKAIFSGISEYVIDGDAKVVGQRDYWDTINLGQSGTYSPEAPLAGLGDLGEQLLPAFLRRAQEPRPVLNGDWVLLRRADEYRVYRTKDKRVFAIPAPGVTSDSFELARVLKGHGLVPGAALRARVTGQGELFPADPRPTGTRPGGAVPATDLVEGVELAPPHPWDGEPPPG